MVRTKTLAAQPDVRIAMHRHMQALLGFQVEVAFVEVAKEDRGPGVARSNSRNARLLIVTQTHIDSPASANMHGG